MLQLLTAEKYLLVVAVASNVEKSLLLFCSVSLGKTFQDFEACKYQET